MNTWGNVEWQNESKGNALVRWTRPREETAVICKITDARCTLSGSLCHSQLRASFMKLKEKKRHIRYFVRKHKNWATVAQSLLSVFFIQAIKHYGRLEIPFVLTDNIKSVGPKKVRKCGTIACCLEISSHKCWVGKHPDFHAGFMACRVSHLQHSNIPHSLSI